jgi:hypothetical protein
MDDGKFHVILAVSVVQTEGLKSSEIDRQQTGSGGALICCADSSAALARGAVNDGIGVSPLLLPSAPAGNLDNLNWDEVGNFQAAVATTAAQQIPVRRASVVGETALPQVQLDLPAVDQVVAQTENDVHVGMDE